MAPELLALSNPAPLDPIVDVWSLGATLFMLVVGCPPWVAPTWPELGKAVMQTELIFPQSAVVGDRKLDPEIRNLISKMLTKDPRKRATLVQVMQHEWVTAEGTQPMEPEDFSAALSDERPSSASGFHEVPSFSARNSFTLEKGSDDSDDDSEEEEEVEDICDADSDIFGGDDDAVEVVEDNKSPSSSPKSKDQPKKLDRRASQINAEIKKDNTVTDPELLPIVPVPEMDPQMKVHPTLLYASQGGGAGNLRLGLRVGRALEQGPCSYMEDRVAVLPDLPGEMFVTRGARLSQLGEMAFFAVYDGHGGSSACDLLSLDLHFDVAKSWADDTDNPKRALQHAADEIDRRLIEQDRIREQERKKVGGLVRHGSVASKQFEHSSGSTASLVVVTGNELHTSWVGDSRVVLCRGGEAVDLTWDHVVTDPRERKHLEERGGTIIRGRLFGDLKVSRGFGDRRHKLTGTLQCHMGYRLELIGEEDEFVVLCSDGVWDVLGSQEVINFVRRKLRSRRDADEAARAVVAKASSLGTHDNSCCVVVVFHQEPWPEGYEDQPETPLALPSLAKLTGMSASTPEISTPTVDTPTPEPKESEPKESES